MVRDVSTYMRLKWDVATTLHAGWDCSPACLFHPALSFIFSLKMFFSNVYISENTIFECSYFLRYYCIFKVRKFESLFLKVNTYLEKTSVCIGLWVEQIFLINKQYAYFSILGVAIAVPFLCHFQKLQLIFVISFELIFAALHFYINELKKFLSDV